MRGAIHFSRAVLPTHPWMHYRTSGRRWQYGGTLGSRQLRRTVRLLIGLQTPRRRTVRN